MANYSIHACPKRMWYVDEYLVPSMLAQGINENDIFIYNDTEGVGNLQACLNAFESTPQDYEGTWHLQDDVLISSNFKEQTEKHNRGIVYGFTGYYDYVSGTNKNEKIWFPAGIVKPAQMWSSFQCVRIPNKIAHDFVDWFENYMRNNRVYAEYVKTGKCDDWFFKQYCKSELKHVDILNLAPNIVEHVDRLIGGSVINELREEPEYRARFWEEPELYEELRVKLAHAKA